MAITIPEKVNKILFLGNSITYSGQYISYIETYITLKYPERKLEFINVGLPSETVSGLSEDNHAQGKFPRPDLRERLHSILSKVKPDLVFASYGINDGIYLPYNDVRFQKFKDGILWLHEEIVKIESNIIHLTPSVYDGSNAKAYDNVMDIYSDWLISNKYTNDWKIIDIHGPMKKQLEEQHIQDSKFSFSTDGVHLTDIGHWIMAQQVLLNLGENEVSEFKTFEETLNSFENGKQIFEIISKKQTLLKDAWLTATGHNRPGMSQSIPLEEAQLNAKKLKSQINKLLNL